MTEDAWKKYPGDKPPAAGPYFVRFGDAFDYRSVALWDGAKWKPLADSGKHAYDGTQLITEWQPIPK